MYIYIPRRAARARHDHVSGRGETPAQGGTKLAYRSCYLFGQTCYLFVIGPRTCYLSVIGPSRTLFARWSTPQFSRTQRAHCLRVCTFCVFREWDHLLQRKRRAHARESHRPSRWRQHRPPHRDAVWSLPEIHSFPDPVVQHQVPSTQTCGLCHVTPQPASRWRFSAGASRQRRPRRTSQFQR